MNILGCLDRPRPALRARRTDVATSRTTSWPGAQPDDRLRLPVFNLLPRTRALENVELPLIYQRRRRPRTTARAHGGAGAVGLGDRLRPRAERAVRRPAAARRHRPGARHRPAAHPRRRAHGQPRLRVRARGDGLSSRAPRAGPHDRAHHPRPGRGRGRDPPHPHPRRAPRPREPRRAHPLAVSRLRTGRLARRAHDAGRDHRRGVGGRARRRGAGDDVEHHQPPSGSRDEPPHDQRDGDLVGSGPRRRRGDRRTARCRGRRAGRPRRAPTSGRARRRPTPRSSSSPTTGR